MLMLLVVLGFTSKVLASSKPSSENCASAGSVTVYCYDCVSDPKKYMGKVAVVATYSGNGCVDNSEARQRCSEVYNYKQSSVGYYATYTINITSFTNTFIKSCIDEVGRQ